MVMALGAQLGRNVETLRRGSARLAGVASVYRTRVRRPSSGNWNTTRMTSAAVCLTRSDQVLIFASALRARGRREVVPGFGIVCPKLLM